MSTLLLFHSVHSGASRALLEDAGLPAEVSTGPEDYVVGDVPVTVHSEHASCVVRVPAFPGYPCVFYEGQNRFESLAFPKTWAEVLAWKNVLDAEPVIPLEVPHVWGV